MAHRTFVDSAGREWHVFDVVPREEERRHYDRRSGEVRFDDIDERRDRDRRLTVGRASTIARGAGAGWLVFEDGADRRRLAPIPPDWTRCSDAQLDAYCRSARPVPQRSASTG